MFDTLPMGSMTWTAGTVLVADDDGGMRSLYQCWLAAFDEVRTAADGEDALGRLDEDVDVVLLDREMPRTDGVAVARELDRRDLDPAVVMISGVRPDVDLLDIPVDDYLQKPVSGEAVRGRVRRAIAVAEQPRPRRHLLSLDSRRRIVEAATPRRALTADPTYQRVVNVLDRHTDTVRSARHAVAVERHEFAHRTAPDHSLPESP